MTELKGMKCQKSSEPLIFYDFMWSTTTWWWCGPHMKSSSPRYGLVHILSSSSWKSALDPSVSALDPSVVYDLYVKSSSRYSLVRILSTKSSNSVKIFSFLRFYVINYLPTIWWTYEIELLLLSRAHFVDILKEWSEPFSFFLRIFVLNRARATVSCTFCRRLQTVWKTFSFTIFMLNRALATVSCSFCLPLSISRRAPAEAETLQRRPRTAILPEGTQGLTPESVFSN